MLELDGQAYLEALLNPVVVNDHQFGMHVETA